MPAPSASLSTLRPELAGSLEQFDLAMDRQGFIALKVLPVLEVAVAAGTFGKITLESLLQNREVARSPGAGYARGTFQFTTDSFATVEYGAEEPIDDRQAKLYASYLDAELVHTQRALDAVLRAHERRVAAQIFNTTTWTGASLTTAVSTPWTTVATATPVTDVEAACAKVWAGTGLWPNALILTRKGYRALRRCTQILDMVKYQGFQDVRPGKVNLDHMAAVFDLPYIIVAGSSKNSADEGQTRTVASVWTETMAMVARIAETGDIQEPCLGRTFHWGEDGSEIGGHVESYRDETVRGDVVRVRHDVHEKTLYTECGHLLTSVTA